MPRLAALLAICLLPGLARAQTRPASEGQLTRQLDQRVTIAWKGQQLGPALERLATAQRIAVWLDRRVDPTTPVVLSISEQPLHDALVSVAERHGWSIAPYHGVLYVGPTQTAGELETLRALARMAINKTPPVLRSRWLRAEAWEIPRLSEPRTLLNELAKAAGAHVHGGHLIPHDLWPERSLSPLAAIDRAVLLLSGFDLTCQLSADGRQLKVMPINRPVHISRSYTVSRARADAVEAALAEMPAAKATRSGQRLTLAAAVQEHQRLAAAINGETSPPSKLTKPRTTRLDSQRFTLKITNQPVGRVIDQLAQQLKLTIEWSPGLIESPGAGRDVAISCDIHEVDLDGLLTAVLSPAGLDFQRDGKKIRISRAERE